MSSVRERIMEALTNVVKNANVGCAVHRSRATALTRRELPAVLIQITSDTPDQTMIGRIIWTTVVRFSVLTAGDIPDLEADPIVLKLHQALLADKTLGGLTMDIAPADVKFELYNGDGPRGEVALSYQVWYRTLDADISQQG